MRLVKQNTAYNLTVFMTDAADHVSAKTGLTLTITASKDGAAFGAITPTVTELANGWYALSLTASHTDTVGDLALHVTGSGADATDLVLQVRANVLGDTLPANLTQWKGATPSDLQSGRVDSYLGAVAAGVIAAASFAAGALDAVWSTAARTLTAFSDSSGVTTLLTRIAAALTITGGKVDVNDKTGFALTAAYDAAKTAAQAGDAMALTSGERTATGTAVWATTTRELSSGANIVLAKGTGITGFNDLSAAQVNAEADIALADVGLTTTITGRIDDAISSRLAAGSYTAPDNTSISAIKAKTDNLPSDPADASDIAAATNLIASGLAAVKAKTDNLPASPAATGDIPSVSAIADEVRTNLAIELAHLDADISSRSDYDGSDPSGVTTLLARLTDTRAALLDNLNNLDAAISAITLSSAERNALADAYLDRTDGIELGMTPREAYRLMTAAALGLASGMDADPPAPRFRDTNDTKDRIAAVCDAFGNRLSVTLDAS